MLFFRIFYAICEYSFTSFFPIFDGLVFLVSEIFAGHLAPTHGAIFLCIYIFFSFWYVNCELFITYWVPAECLLLPVLGSSLSKKLNLFLDYSGITYVVRFRAANFHKDQTISTDSEKIFSCHRAPSSRICRLLTVCIKEGILTWHHSLGAFCALPGSQIL